MSFEDIRIKSAVFAGLVIIEGHGKLYGSTRSFFRLIEGAVAKRDSCPVLEGVEGRFPNY